MEERMPSTTVVALAILCIFSSSFLPGSAFASPLIFDGPNGGGTAALISPLEKWEPTATIEAYTSILESAGYSVDAILDEAASVEFFRTGLSNYDSILLRLDSFYYEGLSYFCTGQTLEVNAISQRSEYAKQYAAEIAAHEISLEGPCVGFSMIYILHSYAKGSLHGLVIAVGPGTPELAAPFLSRGAAAFITYDTPVEYSLSWGRTDCTTLAILRILAEGYTVKNAVAQFYIRATRGHGNTATWPSIYWVGDGDYTM